MKKIITLLLISMLSGCTILPLGSTSEIPANLELKATKEKIISYKTIKEKSDAESKVDDSIVSYKYISDEANSEVKPYYEKDSNYSKAEYLSVRKDGYKPLVFYATPKWYKENDKNYNIKEATTTKSAFEEQTSLTLTEKITYFIKGQTALAATTTYTSSTSWTPSCASNIQILAVGGGGGGGGAHGALGYVRKAGGGGGAGGMVSSSSLPVTVQSYTITVGTGGSGGVYNNNGARGEYGSDSYFRIGATFYLSAHGGGGGGGADGSPTDAEMSGVDGGSGGGVAVGNYDDAATYGDEITGEGNHGGNNYYDGTTTHSASGGGGGAGAVGGNAASATRGEGGSGSSNSITGSSVTYATGGPGGAVGTAVTGAAGTDGLGNGGGGAVSSTILSYSGGDGGDGVIIIAENCTAAAPLLPIPDDAFFD